MVGIVYFSGTGNTAYVANYMKNKLTEEVDLIPMHELLEKDLFVYESLYVGFPVYACEMPEVLYEILDQKHYNKATKIHLFSTMAFYSGSAIKKARKLFENKGLNVISTIEIKMPGSDGLGFMEKESKTVKKIEQTNFEVLANVDQWLLESKVKRDIVHSSILSAAIKVTFKIVEDKMKKKFYADDKCILCKKCQKICPMENISVTDGVSFDKRCILCMRCLHQCPVEAIQIGKKTIGKYRYKGPDGKASF